MQCNSGVQGVNHPFFPRPQSSHRSLLGIMNIWKLLYRLRKSKETNTSEMKMKKTCIGNERPNIKKLKEIRHHHMRHTICQPLSPVIKKCKETPKNSIQETSAEKNEKSRKDNNKMPRKFPEGGKETARK
ncbi:hypothetical protein EYC84_001711 [Monilinia fructicola]|uniref:Uncharacterized protein n=1 Tax=Monilinia fructicola TaxID=38448 RepID=A0A5M9JVB9_MONFR|nr:hypothetical protein EYC84_001711 [Monilinia fructicola]